MGKIKRAKANDGLKFSFPRNLKKMKSGPHKVTFDRMPPVLEEFVLPYLPNERE